MSKKKRSKKHICTLGYIFWAKNLGKDEKIFIKLAKKKRINLVLINIAKEIDESELERTIKKCDIVFNNSAEDYAIELVKTIEEFKVKVIDSSKTFYYLEDKWMFFLKCKEHNIPTPETILLSENIPEALKELKEFKKWPVVLKRIEGTTGDYVFRAETLREAERVINKIWKKGSERLPIIAQEMVKSPCYRVTVIDGNIEQTARKMAKGWKATGVKDKFNKKFPIDKDLKEIINKTMKMADIKICGIDLLKKMGGWCVLEINAEPAFDFIAGERTKLISKTLDFLVKEARKK